MKNNKLSNTFNNIYEKDLWTCGSGPGSTMKATKGYRKVLEKFLKENSIKSVVDFGCGDWQFSKNIDWSGIDYIGYDIADFVVNKNKKIYETKNIKFEKTPENYENIKGADLLICKDVLQHLPNEIIHKFLTILPKFKFALLTNDSSLFTKNPDIEAGSWRLLNLKKYPFNLEGKIIYNNYDNIRLFLIRNIFMLPKKETLLWENDK